jgi:hypothetical protein
MCPAHFILLDLIILDLIILIIVDKEFMNAYNKKIVSYELYAA